MDDDEKRLNIRRRQTTRNVRDQLEMLDDFLVDYSDGRGPSSEGEVQFTELITSALSILDEELGNRITTRWRSAARSAKGRSVLGPLSENGPRPRGEP